MNIDRTLRLLKSGALTISLVTSVLLLTACGGSDNKSASSSSSVSLSSSSSSSSNSSSAVWPDLEIAAIAPKTLSISWTPVDGATSYQLLKSDGAGGYVAVGTTVTDTSATDTVSVHLQNWLNGSYMVEACIDTECQNSNPAYVTGAVLGTIGYVKASNTGANDWFGWSLDLSADGTTLAVAALTEDSHGVGVNSDAQTSDTSVNSGAVYVFELIDGAWIQQAYIKASNTEQPNSDPDLTLPNDRFGYRVSLSDDGNTLAVAALNEDSYASGINCDQGNFKLLNSKGTTATDDDKLVHLDVNVGAVYVFKRLDQVWAQEAYLKPSHLQFASDELQTDALQFGASLRISGDGSTIAVGTLSDARPMSGIASSSSSADPSRCENANPTPSSATDISSSSSLSSSSLSSSSSSSNSSNAIPGGRSSGAVYIFSLTEDGWMQEVYIKASNADARDAFGADVALSTDGNTLAVGAPEEDSRATGINGDQTGNYVININGSNQQINSGSAYIFRRIAQTWTQESYIKPAHTSWGLKFGSSLDLSADGNTLAVGAVGDISRATGINGNPADYDLVDVDLPLPSAGAFASGAAYIFTFNGTTWTQNAYIKASNAEANDQFGKTLSLSGDGNYLAVGTSVESSVAKGINGDQTDNSATNTGAVYVFSLNNTAWSQTSYVKPSNTKGGDRFGAAIDLSKDGSTMAVGAYREASKATGVNGDQNDKNAPSAGAVYLY